MNKQNEGGPGNSDVGLDDIASTRSALTAARRVASEYV